MTDLEKHVNQPGRNKLVKQVRSKINELGIEYIFFQAEDGIRDRSPSRGLGDVYKRQQQDLYLLRFQFFLLYQV